MIVTESKLSVYSIGGLERKVVDLLLFINHEVASI